MEAQKKKKMVIIGGASIMFLVLVYFLLGDKISFSKAEASGNTVTTVIPEAESMELSDSKSDIYRAKTQRERDAESYFAGLGRQEEDNGEDISLISEPVPSEPEQLSGMKAHDAMATLFPGTIPEEAVPSVKATPAKKSSLGGGGGSGRKTSTVASMTADEKMEFDRKRAEMMRDVLIGTETAPGSDNGFDVPEQITPAPITDVHTSKSIISSLDDDTLGDASSIPSEGSPVRCIFVRDEKIKNGQRVTIRILENLTVDGLVIPANSHLSATCTIGDRLSMRVTSIELKGKIYGLSLDAYDIDGGLGIYCPETGSTRNNNTIKNNAVTAATSSVGGMVGRVAGAVVNTGAALVRNSSGDVTVSISSGYEFYIMKTKKR